MLYHHIVSVCPWWLLPLQSQVECHAILNNVIALYIHRFIVNIVLYSFLFCTLLQIQEET